MRTKKRTLNAYWNDLPVGATARGKVRRIMREKLVAAGGDGRSLAAMNDGRREMFADAIFAVENEIESRSGGMPDHPTVVALNTARNRVYDDLGWNDQ